LRVGRHLLARGWGLIINGDVDKSAQKQKIDGE